MISHHFSDVEQSTIYVVDGKLSDIENFDEIALEHWEYFGNKKPMFNKEYLAGLRVVIAQDNEKTVGYVFYGFFKSPYHTETWCQVDMFFLKPSHRGKGIGKDMFRLVEQMDCLVQLFVQPHLYRQQHQTHQQHLKVSYQKD